MALQVELVSAEAQVWAGEATRVICRTTEGDIGVLSGHAPTLAVLAAGDVKIATAEQGTVTVQVQDGFLSVEHDRVTLVSDSATLTDGD